MYPKPVISFIIYIFNLILLSFCKNVPHSRLGNLAIDENSLKNSITGIFKVLRWLKTDAVQYLFCCLLALVSVKDKPFFVSFNCPWFVY